MPPKIPSSGEVGPTFPSETRSGTGLNEKPTEAQRNPKSPTDLQDGPVIGSNGEYRPASYKTSRGFIRTDN